MAIIAIPTVLRHYADGQNEVRLAGGTVDEVLTQLTERYPELRRQLYSDTNKLRSFINVFLNDENVRFLQKGATPVSDGDTLSIIPAIAGGRTAASSTISPGSPGVELMREEIRRYSRHLIVPEVGLEDQKRLKQSSVLLIGVGPAA